MEDLTVRIECPACGRECPKDFVRGSLQTYRHKYNGRCGVWLAVAADPSGENHIVREIGEDERHQGVLRELAAEHLLRVKRAVVADIAAELEKRGRCERAS